MKRKRLAWKYRQWRLEHDLFSCSNWLFWAFMISCEVSAHDLPDFCFEWITQIDNLTCCWCLEVLFWRAKETPNRTMDTFIYTFYQKLFKSLYWALAYVLLISIDSNSSCIGKWRQCFVWLTLHMTRNHVARVEGSTLPKIPYHHEGIGDSPVTVITVMCVGLKFLIALGKKINNQQQSHGCGEVLSCNL